MSLEWFYGERESQAVKVQSVQKNLSNQAKSYIRDPKRIFLWSFIIYTKNIALPLVTSVKKVEKVLSNFQY
jgi:hypothetical protein